MVRLTIAALILMIYFSGCQAIGLIPTQPGDLTPDQLQSLSQTHKVYKCFTLGGPPPTGSIGMIMLPKDDPSTVKFLPGCHLSMQ